jgi:hypothetical protein
MAESLFPCEYVDPGTGDACRRSPTRLYVIEIEDVDGVEIQYLGHRCVLHAPRGPSDDPPSDPERPAGTSVRPPSDVDRSEDVPSVDLNELDEPRAMLVGAAR